jgi:hypothetical protein
LTDDPFGASAVKSRNERLPYVGVEIVAFGETKTAAQWSEDSRCLICGPQIVERIRNGMSAEDAITALTPYDTYEAWGERKTLAQWGHDPRSAVAGTTIRARLQFGVPFQVALTTRAWIPLDNPINEGDRKMLNLSIGRGDELRTCDLFHRMS